MAFNYLLGDFYAVMLESQERGWLRFELLVGGREFGCCAAIVRYGRHLLLYHCANNESVHTIGHIVNQAMLFKPSEWPGACFRYLVGLRFAGVTEGNAVNMTIDLGSPKGCKFRNRKWGILADFWGFFAGQGYYRI